MLSGSEYFLFSIIAITGQNTEERTKFGKDPIRALKGREVPAVFPPVRCLTSPGWADAVREREGGRTCEYESEL